MKKSEITRQYILEKAFDLIYTNGYQATSIDKIIQTTNMTKGALFYHFKNKEEMGLAMIKEVIAPRFSTALITPIKGSDDPMKIYNTILSYMLGINDQQLINGCSTNNLIQEMAPINSKFRLALREILDSWQTEIQQCLQRAASQGKIAQHSFHEIAAFIVCSYEGFRGIGKIYQHKSLYQAYLNQLKSLLQKL